MHLRAIVFVASLVSLGCEGPTELLAPGLDAGVDAGSVVPDVVDAGEESTDSGPLVCNPPCDRVMHLAAGADHTCAVMADGTVRCWGAGGGGQLGRGDRENFGDEPGELDGAWEPAIVAEGLVAVQIAAGRVHSCLLTSSGAVLCWGGNENAQLGIRGGDRVTLDDFGVDHAFVSLPGSAERIVARGDSSCAILATKEAWCWGAIARGAPQAIDTGGGDVVSITLDDHACVRFDDGRLKCWGDNTSGKLGLGDTAPRSRPDALPFVDVGTDAPAIDVAVGSISTIALHADGAVRWWGEVNMRIGVEAVGDEPGEMGAALRPLAFGVRDVAAVSLYADNPCVLLVDGRIVCWGFDHAGLVGTSVGTIHGTRVGTHPPIDLGPNVRARGVVVGEQHACAWLTDDSVKCWGNARRGALGRPYDGDRWGDNLPRVPLGRTDR